MKFEHTNRDCCNRRTKKYYQAAEQRYAEPTHLIKSREYYAKKHLKAFKAIGIINSLKNLESLLKKCKIRSYLYEWRKFKEDKGEINFKMVDFYID